MILRINGIIQQIIENSGLVPTDDTLKIAVDIVAQHPDISLFQAVEAAKLLEVLHHACSCTLN